MTKVFFKTSILPLLSLVFFAFLGCNPMVSRFTSRALNQFGEEIRPASNKITAPLRTEGGVSILWVGHATVLIQIDDKVIITDPVFTKTVGMLGRRSIESGLDPSSINRLDFILISHLHFDHFSYGSLDMLPMQARLVVPPGGAEYTPAFGFTEILESKTWQTIEQDGLRITPVPVQHFGGRYGFDVLWGPERPYTGYIIEYKGTTIFFAGDTGYNPELFKEIGRRYRIDVALLPIAPIEPRDFMRRIHTDPADALQVFEDVGAKIMIPMHYDTFFQGLEPEVGYARQMMRQLIEERNLQERVKMLDIGEQIVLK